MVLLEGRRRWQGQARKGEVDRDRLTGKPQQMPWLLQSKGGLFSES